MGVYSISNRQLELTTGVIECAHEPGIEGAYHIVAESEANYNAIMQAVGVAELAVFEATGSEMVYEAADVKGFFGKMKEFFKNLLEKIKGLFKKFFAMFDSYVKNDKDFVEKYKKHLLGVETRGFKYKGFVFSPEKVDLDKMVDKMDKVYPEDPTKLPDSKDALENIIHKYEDRVELVEKLRAAALGKSGNLEASEYTKELYAMLRSGEDSKQELENISVNEQLQYITANSGLKKAAEKQYSDLEKLCKETITSIEKMERELSKNIDIKDSEKTEITSLKLKAATTHISNIKDVLSLLQIANGAKLTAIKDCNRQAKAICVALMNYKPKNESTSVYESGFLAGVTLR